jgi:uncharacterized membrane-anchored protein YhcB (DUF1043 family)
LPEEVHERTFAGGEGDLELYNTGWMQIAIAAGLLVGGVLLGLLLARGGKGARARARRLEKELRQAQELLASYQDQVAKHFVQTSDLFGDLTRQYTAVWDHLAEGARDLCAERVSALGRGFNDAPQLLTNTPPPEAEAPAAEAPPELEDAEDRAQDEDRPQEDADPTPDTEGPTRQP